MSSNSIDFEIENLKNELTNLINSLSENSKEKFTFANIRSLCQNIVDRYYQEGILDRKAIIDINHREEIAYYSTLLQTYMRRATLADNKEEAMRYKDKATVTAERVDKLKSVTKKDRLQVYLKEPYTYEPFDWTQYDF